jgi:hypothetical protein
MNYLQSGNNLRNALTQLEKAIRDFNKAFDVLHQIESPPDVEGRSPREWEAIFRVEDSLRDKAAK